MLSSTHLPWSVTLTHMGPPIRAKSYALNFLVDKLICLEKFEEYKQGRASCPHLEDTHGKVPRAKTHKKNLCKELLQV
jgi:hypothetical protein